MNSHFLMVFLFLLSKKSDDVCNKKRNNHLKECVVAIILLPSTFLSWSPVFAADRPMIYLSCLSSQVSFLWGMPIKPHWPLRRGHKYIAQFYRASGKRQQKTNLVRKAQKRNIAGIKHEHFETNVVCLIWNRETNWKDRYLDFFLYRQH